MTDVLPQGLTYPQSLISLKRKVLDDQLLSLITSLTQRAHINFGKCFPQPPKILRSSLGPTIDESLIHGLRAVKKLFGYYDNDEDPLELEEDLWLKGEYASLDEEEAAFGPNDNIRTRRKLLDKLSTLLKKRRKMGYPCKCCRGTNCSTEEQNTSPSQGSQGQDTSSSQGQETTPPKREGTGPPQGQDTSPSQGRIPGICPRSQHSAVGNVSKPSKITVVNPKPSCQSISGEGPWYSAQDVPAGVSPSKKATNQSQQSISQESPWYSAHDMGDGKCCGIPGMKEAPPLETAKPSCECDCSSDENVLTVQQTPDIPWHSIQDLNVNACCEPVTNDENELPRWMLPRVNYNDGTEQPNKTQSGAQVAPQIQDTSLKMKVSVESAKNASTRSTAGTDSRNLAVTSSHKPKEQIENYSKFQRIETTDETLHNNPSKKSLKGVTAKQIQSPTKNKADGAKARAEGGLSPMTKAKSATAYYKRKCFCRSSMIPMFDLTVHNGKFSKNRVCKCQRQIASELKLPGNKDPCLFSTRKGNCSKYCQYFEKIHHPQTNGASLEGRHVTAMPEKNLKLKKMNDFGVDNKESKKKKLHLTSKLGLFSDVNIKLSNKMWDYLDGNNFGNIFTNHAETSPNKAASSSIGDCSNMQNCPKKTLVSQQYNVQKCNNMSCHNISTDSCIKGESSSLGQRNYEPSQQMEEEKRRLFEERLAREKQRAAPFQHRLKDQTERHRVAEEELQRSMYQKEKLRRPLEAKFRQEYTMLLEGIKADANSCDAMQGSATDTETASPTTATDSVKTSLDLKDEYYERFVYPDDDHKEWQDLLSSDSSSLDMFPFRGVRFPFTELSRQKILYQSNVQRLWSKAEEDRRKQIKMQSLASLEARHQREKMEFLCHRESRQQRHQQRLRRLAIELNLDVANLPMSALSRLDRNVRRQKEIQRLQLKRRIDISERLYREQRRVYLESLDLADAWKQKPKSKNKSVTVESIIEEKIVEKIVEKQEVVIFEVESYCGETGGPVDEQENMENSMPPPEPIQKFRREVKFDKPLLSQLLQLDEWLYGLWADNVAIHRRHPIAADDLFLDVKPKELVFRNYRPENKYTRRAYIDNQCYQGATIELQEILFQDDYYRSLFQVRPTEPVRLLPGMCVDVTVEFFPNAKHMEPFSGALLYSVIRDAKIPLRRLKIGIRCEQSPEITPANPDVQPRILCFPEAPHWNEKNVHVIFRKNVRFINRGDEPYYAQVQVYQEPIIQKEEPPPEPEADLEEVEVVSTVVRRSKSPKGKAPKSLPPEIVVTERPSILMAQAITETCASLIKECADHPMEVFYWDHLYHINVPGKRFVDVTVHFAPPQPGEYKQTFVVTFHSVSRDILGEVQIDARGKTIPLPLLVSPSSGLDFGIIIAANKMTYQDEFKVQNDSCAAITAVPIIPVHLRQYAEIMPRGKVIVNAFSTSTFTLKLYPRKSMSTEARKQYDRTSNTISFFIRVRFCNSSRLCNVPPLTIPVTAKILSLDPSWLILTPKMIDLGIVTTNNTVHTLIHLVNTTMIKLDFVILGAPKGAIIQPGYGRGSILPGETLDFDLLYSPRAIADVPIAGDQVKVFRLRAESLISIATHDSKKRKGQSMSDTMSSIMEDQTAIETVHPVSIAEDGSETLSYDDVNEIDDLINEAVEFESCMSISNEAEMSTVRSFKSANKPNELECKVLIQDPRCELSVTRLVLPPTPCGSSYIACIQLRTQNSASLLCKCGGTNAAAKIRWHTTAFTIESTSENFEVEPSEGSIAAGQFIPVFVKFIPVLPKSEVDEMATVIRREKIQLLLQEKPKKGSKGKKSGKKQAPAADQAIAENEIVIEPEDIRDAEKILMETMEPKLMESTIICRLWTRPENFDCDENDDRYEELQCQVISTMIRPEFIILSDMTIDFGPTALGDNKPYKIQLQSLICKRIKVRISPASPFSAFKVPAVCSYVVEPQHILELPTAFKPEISGDDCEKFRLTSGKTAVTIRMIGLGVTPQFILKPTFVVCRLEAFPGLSAECSFEIMNDCIAKLPLHLRQDFVRQGKEIEPLAAISAPSSANSKQAKSKPEKKSKSKDKDSKHNYMSDFLTPEEILVLESSEESEDPAALFDDSGLLTLEPTKKGNFKIHFRPPAVPDPNLQKSKGTADALPDSQTTSYVKDVIVSDNAGETKGNFANKAGKKKSVVKIIPEHLKVIYIAKYSLIVGNLLVTREFFIIGKLKKGIPPKEKKSKSKGDVPKKKK